MTTLPTTSTTTLSPHLVSTIPTSGESAVRMIPTHRPMRREDSGGNVAQPRDNLADIEAEQSALGSILLAYDHGEAQAGIDREGITPECFTDGYTREIYRLINVCLTEGATPDLVNVGSRLHLINGDQRTLRDYLSMLPDKSPSFANLSTYTERLRELLARREAVEVADSIRARALDPRGSVAEAQHIAREFSELSLVRKQDDDGLPPIMDGYDLDQADIKTPPLLVSGLLHQGCKLAIGGGSKSYKTYVLLDLMLSVAYGKPWLGQDTTQGRVMYLNFELHDWQIRQRLHKIASAKGITLKPGAYDAWNLRGCAAGYREMIPKILDRIKGRDYRLVIFDPLYKMLGGADENSARDISDLLNHVEHIASTGPAIAFGSHFSKGNQAGKTSMDRISGSGVFARDPDSIMTITEHEDEDCYVAEFTLRNLPPLEKFGLRWEHPLFVPDDNLNPDSLKQSNAGRKKTHDPQKLLSYIRDTTRESPITVTEWAKRAKVNRSTLSGYLESMREAGYIGTVGDGIAVRKYILQRGLGLLG